jgi:hypothetical protein
MLHLVLKFMKKIFSMVLSTILYDLILVYWSSCMLIELASFLCVLYIRMHCTLQNLFANVLTIAADECSCDLSPVLTAVKA